MAEENFYHHLKLRFAGGCELLFDKKYEISLDNCVPMYTSLSKLVLLLKESYITDRPELFVDASGVNLRPGILVLVNGCDAEVMGGMSYLIKDNDQIEFISTLHGGEGDNFLLC